VSAAPHNWADIGAQHISPALSRLKLGQAMRLLREQAGISHETAGQAIRASVSRISRLELGRADLKLRDVAELCALYGVTDHIQRATLLSMAQLANSPEWWYPYRDVIPSWFEHYLGLERAASLIRGYEIQFAPGLLQTPAYAQALIRSGHADRPVSEIERRIELRMCRQQILRRSRPAQLWVLIDEAALRRPVGDRATMAAQLRYLRDACDMENVTIQVLTFRRGGRVVEGPFTILRLPERELPDVIYLEHFATAVYLDRRSDLYLHTMNVLTMEAESPKETPGILNRILAEV
jgi:transcriptional regulator with XRE-family HTH domain